MVKNNQQTFLQHKIQKKKFEKKKKDSKKNCSNKKCLCKRKYFVNIFFCVNFFFEKKKLVFQKKKRLKKKFGKKKNFKKKNLTNIFVGMCPLGAKDGDSIFLNCGSLPEVSHIAQGRCSGRQSSRNPGRDTKVTPPR